MSIPYPFHVHKEQSVPIRTNRLGVFYHHSSKTYKYPISARNLVEGANLHIHPTKDLASKRHLLLAHTTMLEHRTLSPESLGRVGTETSTNITTRW